MHALLADHEREGLATRVRDEHDRRRMLVELTPAGARTLKRLDTRIQAAQHALLAPLSAPDRRQLHRLLTQLAEHHARQRSG
jgi:DNA-binding MarR family transcriptional regulator